MKKVFSVIFIVLIVAGCAPNRPPAKRAETAPSAGASYYYLASELQVSDGSLKKSLDFLSRAIEQDRSAPFLYYKRAGLYASLGDFSKAKEDLDEALHLKADHVPSLVLLGKIEQSQEKWDEAISFYRRALDQDPDFQEAVFLLIEATVAKKNYPLALETVRRWERRKPEDVTPLFYEAGLHLNFFKDTAKAIDAYRRILKVEPDNFRALSGLADLYLSQSAHRQAVEIFRRMEELAPDDVSLQLRVAVVCYEHKQYDLAIEKFRKLLETYPDSDRVIYYLGVIYENIDRYEEALSEFEKISPSSDFFRDARLHQAYLKKKGNDEEEAIHLLYGGIAVKPQMGPFYEYLAEIYRDRKEWKASEDILKKGLLSSPDRESLYYSLGVTYDRMGEFEKSLEAMRKVLKLNPNNAHALNYIGYSFADRGLHLEEALEILRKAISLKPDDSYITDSLGWAYYRSGDMEQAATYILKAHQLNPKEPTILEHMGDIALANKAHGKALHYFRRALSLLKGKNEASVAGDYERVKKKIESISN